MKMMLKRISIVMAFVLISALMLSGCGKSGDELTTAATQDNAGSVAKENTANDNAAAGNEAKSNNGERKKIVIVGGSNTQQFRTDQVDNALKTLGEKGYNSQNSDITTIKLDDEGSETQMFEKIQQAKPDVVIIFASGGFTNLVKSLEGTGIPVVLESNAEAGYADENGVPKQSITGLYTMPKDMVKNSYEFLNKIAPINGKKAVFLTAPGMPMFDKANVEAALKPLNIELKAYVGNITTWEDWEKAILKYNSDAEVGWVLIGINPGVYKDGKAVDWAKAYPWLHENIKKPVVSYWDEGVVSVGYVPCALAVDFQGLANQAAEMAARILNGEDIKNVKAESPKKISIILNMKKADYMGIKFPVDILGGAKVYTDYNGTIAK